MLDPTVDPRYPRILVIAPNTFVRSEGGGNLLSDLFQGWPASKLASIYTNQVGDPDKAICGHAYQLYPRPSRKPMGWVRRSWDYARGVNESLDGAVSMRMTNSLLAWLRTYDPQVVYSFLGRLSLSRLTNTIVDLLGVPLVIHIMDDYVSDWPVCGIPERNIFPVAQILNRLNRREFLKAAERARLRLSLSDAMTETYRLRYGLEFQAVRAGAELPGSSAPIDPHPTGGSSTDPVRIFYGGSVLRNTNHRAIVEVAEAVRRLRDRAVNIELVLACSARSRALLSELDDRQHVRFVSMVPHQQVPHLLRQQDILLLPFNFDPGSVRFIRYSWPSKIPEYLFSGVPILIYGPSVAAFVQSAQTKGWALAVDRQDATALEHAIEQLASDKGLRREIAAVAGDLGRHEHDIRRIRSDFQHALREVAAATGAAFD